MRHDDSVALTAQELHRRAVEQCIRGSYAMAEATLARAAQRTNDPNVMARIAGTRAVVLQRTGHPLDAERTCVDALDARELSAHTRAILLGQLGALAKYDGRLDDADRHLTSAIDSLAADPVAAARLRMNRAMVSVDRRRADAAAADLEVAVETFDANGLATDAAQARHNRALVSLLMGDLVTALNRMSEARPLAVTTPVAGATADVDRAEVLRDAGLTTEAERILASTAVVFGAHRMPQSRGEAEYSLASSQLTHDPVRAGRTAAAAARRFRALGSEAWAARAEALQLRAALSGVSRRAPSIDTVAHVASELDRLGFGSEAAALRLAAALSLARRGESHEAGERMPAVRVPASASMEVRLLAHETRAVRATARGRHGEARRHAAAGLDALARWQDAFGSLDLQTSIAMHGSGLLLAGLSSAVHSRRPDVVFEWSERTRHLHQQVVPLRPPPDEEFAADLAELRMLRANGPTWLTDPRAIELRERTRERQWSRTGSARFDGHTTLDVLRSGLGSDAALIAFVFSGDALTALVVTAVGEAVLDVPGFAAIRDALPGLRADLDMSASVRTGPMADVVRRSLESRLATLSSVLLDAAVTLAGSRRLVITAPGILAGIPWAMLPALRGHVFTLATSATRWLRDRDLAPGGAVGFAVGPRVARGDEEVDAAASAWPAAPVLRGAVATVDAVTALAADVDVLHVAAHGRHAVDNPLFSGLELADGVLFGYDIDRMPRVPATVVLSACEVGRSSVRWGEEAIGMTRGWLHAGTRAVVATPVVVADDVACELLGAMHVGLSAGVPPAEALAGASVRTGIVAPFQVHGAGF